MTRANILLTRNGQKCVCVIDSSAYPDNLPEMLAYFDDWVSEWHELRINAEYVYEINFDKRIVRGWRHSCRDWSAYSIQTALKQLLPAKIALWLPKGWRLNRDKSSVQFTDYGIDEDGAICITETNVCQ